MHESFTGLKIKLQGHLRILEYPNRAALERRQPSRTLLNKRNAIHRDHASILVADALANRTDHAITFMVFGNGGTSIDSTGTVTFRTPNDTGMSPDLYNSTFFQMVDDTRGALPGNQMGVRHIGNSFFTDMDIRCLIDQHEPFGQLASNTFDGSDSITAATDWGAWHSQFAFDEIGLKLADGTLLTHVIFTPVIKTASSILEVIYTIRVVIEQALIEPLPISASPHLIGQQVSTEVGTITFPGSFVIMEGVEATAESNTFAFPPFFGCHHPSIFHWSSLNQGTTITGGNGGGPELAQTCATSSGRFYFEVTMNAGAAAHLCAIGIALPAATETDIAANWTNGAGYRTNSDVLVNGGLADFNIGQMNPGTTVAFAFDTVAHKMYIRVGGGFADGTSNPNSGPSFDFGGYSFAGLGATAYVLTILFAANTTDQFTINNGPTFAFVPPMAYGLGWGGSIPNSSSYSTWDTGTAVHVTFASDNYSAFGDGIAQNGLRSANTITGKRYFEYTTSELTANDGFAAIVDGSSAITSATPGHSVGMSNLGNANGEVYNNAIGQFAVDEPNKLVWMRGSHTDHWNGNPAADPATGIGGLSLAALVGAFYFQMGSGGAGSVQPYVLVSNPAYFNLPVPTGFTPGF